jgi:hypothetical protein
MEPGASDTLPPRREGSPACWGVCADEHPKITIKDSHARSFADPLVIVRSFESFSNCPVLWRLPPIKCQATQAPRTADRCRLARLSHPLVPAPRRSRAPAASAIMAARLRGPLHESSSRDDEVRVSRGQSLRNLVPRPDYLGSKPQRAVFVDNSFPRKRAYLPVREA